MAKTSAELKAFGKEPAKEEEEEENESLADYGGDGDAERPQESSEEEGAAEASEAEDAEPTLASRMAAKQQAISEEDEDGLVRLFLHPEGCPSQYVHKVQGYSRTRCKRCPGTTWSKHQLSLYVDTKQLSEVDKEDKELLRTALEDHMGRCGSHEDFQSLGPAVQLEAIRKTPLAVSEETEAMREQYSSAPPKKRRRTRGRRGQAAAEHPAGAEPKAEARPVVRLHPAGSLQLEVQNVLSMVSRAAAAAGVQPGAVVTDNIQVAVSLALLVRASEIRQRVSSAPSAQNVGLLRLARDLHQENQVLSASFVEMRQVIDEATGSRTAL